MKALLNLLFFLLSGSFAGLWASEAHIAPPSSPPPAPLLQKDSLHRYSYAYFRMDDEIDMHTIEKIGFRISLCDPTAVDNYVLIHFVYDARTQKKEGHGLFRLSSQFSKTISIICEPLPSISCYYGFQLYKADRYGHPIDEPLPLPKKFIKTDFINPLFMHQSSTPTLSLPATTDKKSPVRQGIKLALTALFGYYVAHSFFHNLIWDQIKNDARKYALYKDYMIAGKVPPGVPGSDGIKTGASLAHIKPIQYSEKNIEDSKIRIAISTGDTA